jgi:hypothetical protein
MTVGRAVGVAGIARPVGIGILGVGFESVAVAAAVRRIGRRVEEPRVDHRRRQVALPRDGKREDGDGCGQNYPQGKAAEGAVSPTAQ